MKYKRAWCATHMSQIHAVDRTPNHLLHFALGFLTVGAWWLLVWLPLCLFRRGGFRCWRCGELAFDLPLELERLERKRPSEFQIT